MWAEGSVEVGRTPLPGEHHPDQVPPPTFPNPSGLASTYANTSTPTLGQHPSSVQDHLPRRLQASVAAGWRCGACIQPCAQHRPGLTWNEAGHAAHRRGSDATATTAIASWTRASAGEWRAPAHHLHRTTRPTPSTPCGLCHRTHASYQGAVHLQPPIPCAHPRIVPARHASTRLVRQNRWWTGGVSSAARGGNKPPACTRADAVVVATDDQRSRYVEDFGGRCSPRLTTPAALTKGGNGAGRWRLRCGGEHPGR